MSCWSCLKRLFCYEEEVILKPTREPTQLSLYIQQQKRYVYEDSVVLPGIDEETEESTWSLKKNHDQSKFIKKFNQYLKLD